LQIIKTEKIIRKRIQRFNEFCKTQTIDLEVESSDVDYDKTKEK
jgi:hypothetical protein